VQIYLISFHCSLTAKLSISDRFTDDFEIDHESTSFRWSFRFAGDKRRDWNQKRNKGFGFGFGMRLFRISVFGFDFGSGSSKFQFLVSVLVAALINKGFGFRFW